MNVQQPTVDAVVRSIVGAINTKESLKLNENSAKSALRIVAHAEYGKPPLGMFVNMIVGQKNDRFKDLRVCADIAIVRLGIWCLEYVPQLILNNDQEGGVVS